jgi:DNA topoisomerase I
MPRRLKNLTSFAPEDLARLARLRYVTDQDPGLSRRRNGLGFTYITARGTPLRDLRKITRIEALAIPPAWRDVWICTLSAGHLQATGRDARQRKQYIYHQRWQKVAGLAKFARLAEFGAQLPKLRRTIAAQLRGRQLTRERVLAGMIAVLDLTGIRIGNEEYVKENGSYGLASLRNRHVTIGPRSVELRFRAKGGFQRTVSIDAPPVVRLIRECAVLPGSHVFQYVGADDKIHAITATEVNDYLKSLTGEEFTAKDFRTWKASTYAIGALFAADKEDDVTATARKRTSREVVCQTAQMLSNTPSVCRNYYIHPGLLESYEAGRFRQEVGATLPRQRQNFSAEEQILARFLKNWKPTIAD